MANNDKWDELGITFSTIPVDRVEEVLVFLYDNFFPEEPISRSLNVTRHWIVDLLFGENVKAGASVMATDESGKIVGLRLAEVIHKNSWVPWLLDKFVGTVLPKISWIFGRRWDRICCINYLLIDVLMERNIWPMFEEFKCDKILSAVCLSTSKASAGQGLGTELVRRSEVLGKELGCKVTTVIATGLYSGKIFSKRGYVSVKEVLYADFIDEKGELYLKDTRQHTTCVKFVKQLND